MPGDRLIAQDETVRLASVEPKQVDQDRTVPMLAQNQPGACGSTHHT